MTLFPSSQDREIELLSAYMDNALSPGERLKLEARLAVDARLQRELAELKAVRAGLADLPKVKPPRNFTLTPAMAGQPSRRPAAPFVPVLNWATAVAAILFAVVLSVDVLGSARLTPALPREAAPAAQNVATSSDVATSQEVAAPQVAMAEAASETPAEAPAIAEKSVTPTPEEGLALVAPPALPTDSPPRVEGGGGGPGGMGGGLAQGQGEPLTGLTGVGGGGEGDGATETITPEPAADAMATTPSDSAVPVTEETPSLSVAQAAPSEAAATTFNGYSTTGSEIPPVPDETPPEQSPWRVAQLVLGAALIGLITASLVLRRRS